MVLRALLALAATQVTAWLTIDLATTTPPAHSADGYPDPTPALLPTESIAHRVAPWSAVPRARDLGPLLAALSARDAAGMAQAIGPERLDVGPPGASEGWGMSVAPPAAEAWLAALFAAGAQPVVQGAFVPGAEGDTADGDTAAGDTAAGDATARHPAARDPGSGEIVVVVTGLDAGPSPPILVLGFDGPRDPLGETAPAALPLGAAAWHVLADGVGGGRWQRWSADVGYSSLVTALWRSGLGTYWVVR